ncbi:bL27 family ribosomal protein [Candidatus Comchoanobacter bicostacola]|uniref:Large ribosomal subunit protein bL27 n=1 Tax=Candidatus Comchoanobacter bicostacola TaxID=2919598 RepID=A0ABY5DK70_9GAMM|nr:bL27 family ribosomal protein [Candidatus Comchoanobacter bicostacola]UTC24383.1 bL27 family ribosomal protein [Candidatus Comchoanobacter bicostacola]
MATKKAGGSTRNGRDSIGKRRGLKKGNNQLVIAGNILVRQLGQKFRPGPGVARGKDGTLFATVTGVMSITQKVHRDNNLKNKRAKRRFISVTPLVQEGTA